DGAACAIANDCAASVAAAKFRLPACDAVTEQLPAPVIVTVLPLMLQLPAAPKVTGLPEPPPVAPIANGASPKVRLAIAPKTIDCAAFAIANDCAASVAAAKFRLPACDAVTAQLPAPVIVTVLPLMLQLPAAPKVTGLPEPPPVAPIANGASPKVRLAIAPKTIDCAAFAIANDCAASVAAAKFRLPACDAVTAQLPAPVIVTVLPLMLQLPAAPKVTGLPEPPPVAPIANGASPKVRLAIAPKTIDCAAFAIANDCAASVAAAKFRLPACDAVTAQLPAPVIVTVLPLMLQLPAAPKVTGLPEPPPVAPIANGASPKVRLAIAPKTIDCAAFAIANDCAASVAAAKFRLPACDAVTAQLPAPVIVTVLPLMLQLPAAPKVTGLPEPPPVAPIANGASPKVRLAIAPKTIDCAAFAIANDCAASVAAAKFRLPACDAVTAQLPAPVIVTVLPLMLQLPAAPKVTGLPEPPPVAPIANGASPKVRLAIAPKTIDCAAFAIANDCAASVAAAKFRLPACDAVTEQLPAPVIVTVLPLTLQLPAAPNVTGLPEPPPVALIANGASPNVRLASAPKTIDCAAFAIANDCAASVAAAKFRLPACDAVTEQLPAPVIVTVLPLTLQLPAAPNVTGLPEPPPVALIANGASPKVRLAIAPKTIDCAAFAIANDCAASVAAAKFRLPACDAVTAQLPAPVIVTVLPLTLQFPAAPNVTGLPEPPPVALIANGASPNVRLASAPKTIDCAAFAIANDCAAS